MASSKQVVGNPTPRVEGELKVSGEAKYAVDVTLPGMLWGKLLRSPIASGRIKSIDTSKAAALPGVCKAYTPLPVIGVPLASSELKGIDALYSIVQMPPGMPVATVAVGAWGARNAATLAAEILSLGHADVRAKYDEYRAGLAS
jgi:5-(carboxyamino)imidazole ribonucleotide mutase